MRTKFFSALCIASISLIACNSNNNSQKPDLTDRERDGLLGPVKAVLTDEVIVSEQNGQWTETQQASSTSIYDESGKRTTQTPFRIALPGGYAIVQHDPMFSPQARNQRTEEPIPNQGGKWLKNYDAKGYVIEGARYDATGKQTENLSVSYELDGKGNWIKRAIRRSNQNGQTSSPNLTEISYRHIIYFGSPSAPGNGIGEYIPANTAQLKSPVASSEENIARGGTLFNQKCATCHGENGKPETPFAAAMPTKPEDLTGEKARALSEGEIYSAISNGVRSSGMPAFKGRVSDEALWQIALYARQLSRNQSVSGQNIIASSSPKPAQRPSSPQPEQRYQLKGKVISVERELRQVTVEHEEIKGYMGAMTMPFPLNDEKALGRIKKDDRIEATLVVGSGKWELEKVVIK